MEELIGAVQTALTLLEWRSIVDILVVGLLTLSLLLIALAAVWVIAYALRGSRG